jgi:hypothetical protein
MKQARNDLFPRAAFSGDQNRGIGGGDASRQGDDSLYERVFADDKRCAVYGLVRRILGVRRHMPSDDRWRAHLKQKFQLLENPNLQRKLSLTEVRLRK